jgi:26S proteasome regulatory subunit N5
MVSEKDLVAKIDRPGGIVVFHKEISKDANTLLNNWSSSISELLNLVETTCHLINKENMMHNL